MAELIIESAIPKTLERWLHKHPGKVWKISYEDGYCTPSGRAYDVLLAPGWRKNDDLQHVLIEGTVTELLQELNSLVRCDCDECLGRIR